MFFFSCYQRLVCEISICECIKQWGIYSITYNVHLSVFLFSYQKGMGYPKNFVSKWKKIPVKKLSLPMSFYHTAINILMRILSGTRYQDSDKQNLLLNVPPPPILTPFLLVTLQNKFHTTIMPIKYTNLLQILNCIIYKNLDNKSDHNWTEAKKHS